MFCHTQLLLFKTFTSVEMTRGIGLDDGVGSFYIIAFWDDSTKCVFKVMYYHVGRNLY